MLPNLKASLSAETKAGAAPFPAGCELRLYQDLLGGDNKESQSCCLYVESSAVLRWGVCKRHCKEKTFSGVESLSFLSESWLPFYLLFTHSSGSRGSTLPPSLQAGGDSECWWENALLEGCPRQSFASLILRKFSMCPIKLRKTMGSPHYQIQSFPPTIGVPGSTSLQCNVWQGTHCCSWQKVIDFQKSIKAYFYFQIEKRREMSRLLIWNILRLIADIMFHFVVWRPLSFSFFSTLFLLHAVFYVCNLCGYLVYANKGFHNRNVSNHGSKVGNATSLYCHLPYSDSHVLFFPLSLFKDKHR